MPVQTQSWHGAVERHRGWTTSGARAVATGGRV